MSDTTVEQLIVRRATRADARAIVDLYEGLSPESLHSRFFLPIPQQSTRQPCADLAVTIADRYQQRGIGEHLARLAVKEHLETGSCVDFSIMPTNAAATRLARRNHLPLHVDSGTVEGRIHSRQIHSGGRQQHA